MNKEYHLLITLCVKPNSCLSDHTCDNVDRFPTRIKIPNVIETLDQEKDQNSDIEDVQGHDSCKDGDDEKPKDSKTSIDAFALMKKKRDPKLKNNPRKKEVRKQNASVSRPPKVQKQTLIYEKDGDTKTLKAPKAKKPDIQR